jgi:hypothetical protein
MRVPPAPEPVVLRRRLPRNAPGPKENTEHGVRDRSWVSPSGRNIAAWWVARRPWLFPLGIGEHASGELQVERFRRRDIVSSA